MVNKIPYNIVAIEANKLIVRAVMANDDFYHYDLYMDYIHACGWSNFEFDQETIKYIDKNWDSIKRSDIIWN